MCSLVSAICFDDLQVPIKDEIKCDIADCLHKYIDVGRFDQLVTIQLHSKPQLNAILSIIHRRTLFNEFWYLLGEKIANFVTNNVNVDSDEYGDYIKYMLHTGIYDHQSTESKHEVYNFMDAASGNDGEAVFGCCSFDNFKKPYKDQPEQRVWYEHYDLNQFDSTAALIRGKKYCKTKGYAIESHNCQHAVYKIMFKDSSPLAGQILNAGAAIQYHTKYVLQELPGKVTQTIVSAAQKTVTTVEENPGTLAIISATIAALIVANVMRSSRGANDSTIEVKTESKTDTTKKAITSMHTRNTIAKNANSISSNLVNRNLKKVQSNLSNVNRHQQKQIKTNVSSNQRDILKSQQTKPKPTTTHVSQNHRSKIETPKPKSTRNLVNKVLKIDGNTLPHLSSV